MKKIRFGKKAMRIGYLGTLMFLALVVSSCVSYDFIGAWTLKPNTLTYTNPDQHISLTFPSKNWQVYTRPIGDFWNLELDWFVPSEYDPAYHVLVAVDPNLGLGMELIVEPISGEVSLNDYLVLSK